MSRWNFRRAAQMGTSYGFTVAHNIGKHHLHSRRSVPRDMTFGWNTLLGPQGLTVAEQAALTSGSDFWHSTPIDSAGLPAITLTDGPHGVRLQAAATTR